MIRSVAIPSPQELFQHAKADPNSEQVIYSARKGCSHALQGYGFMLVVGPCSLHDPWAARTYAELLARVKEQLPKHWTVVMRAFIEKSRTCGGWKGMLHGNEDLAGAVERLQGVRQLLLQLIECGIAVGAEVVSPLLLPYIEDLLSWGCVGARSCSQTHRECASAAPFPIGFKNSLDGNFDTALASTIEARRPHSFFSINGTGHIAACLSNGNAAAHVISRGSQEQPNYSAADLDSVAQRMRELQLPPYLLVDCSHGNSGFQPLKQIDVALEACCHEAVAGLLIESHHSFGRQPEAAATWSPFVSITDSCLDWTRTEQLLLELAQRNPDLGLATAAATCHHPLPHRVD